VYVSLVEFSYVALYAPLFRVSSSILQSVKLKTGDTYGLIVDVSDDAYLL